MMSKFLMHIAKKQKQKKIKEAQQSGNLVKSLSIGLPSFFGISTLVQILIVVIVCIVVVLVVASPLLTAGSYIQKFKNSVTSLFSSSSDIIEINDAIENKTWSENQQLDTIVKEYTKALAPIYLEYKEKNIELDIALITSTVFYNTSFIQDIEEETNNKEYSIEEIQEVSERFNDISELAENMVSGNTVNEEKYKQYLIETYIPKRFSTQYNNEEDLKDIANSIIENSKETSEEEKEIVENYGSLGIECSSISLKDQSGNITVHELEEYVAGVVQAENGGAGDEALKLQAIAARSFAVKNCKRVIVNSIGDIAVDGKIDQAYTTPTERSTKAAKATEGLVLTYGGEVMTISFASYPKAFYRGGFPGYEAKGYTCGDVTCNTGTDGRNWCKTILYKQPNMEKFELNMPNTQVSGATWNGISLQNQQGHCYGISQIASAYYENEKKYNYQQMVEEFLSPGVQIASIHGTVAEGGTLVAYNNNTFMTRATQPEQGNIHFFSNENSSYAGGFTGQCTWYAFGRANEVLAAAGSNLKWTIWSDAGQWYNQNIKMGANAFEYSSDSTKPRPGSIIVWGQKGSWGHVGFVEKVNDDGTLDFTESNIGFVRSATNPYGWQYVANQTYEQVRTRWASSGYYFQGYIYMLK